MINMLSCQNNTNASLAKKRNAITPIEDVRESTKKAGMMHTFNSKEFSVRDLELKGDSRFMDTQKKM